MKTKLLIAASAILISACSSQLKDVDHKWCPPEAAPQTEQINLAADALFAFGKYQSADLLRAGQQSLQQLAQKITEGYVQVERIRLVGHTDRLGSAKANEKLGLNRAQTVKAALQQYGVSAPIEVASAGESQPVTQNCVGNQANKALIACLQPDRRVSVEIIGLRKAQ